MINDKISDGKGDNNHMHNDRISYVYHSWSEKKFKNENSFYLWGDGFWLVADVWDGFKLIK